MRPAVFLDRDGTLIVDAKYPRDPRLVEPVPGAIVACRQLAKDFLLVVVSNQSGVARGLVTAAEAAAVNARFLEVFAAVSFTGVYYCFHGPDDGCSCRKPSPGMLLEAAHDHGLDLGKSILVGDRASDVEAGRRAGVGKTVEFVGWSSALSACYECSVVG